MKKIIKLTESDLTKIIKRAINEQSSLKKTDLKIPPVIKEKGSELANMAQEIIKKHMEYCKNMVSNKDEFPDVFNSEDANFMDCDFVTKRFKEQPLWVIAELDKTLSNIK